MGYGPAMSSAVDGRRSSEDWCRQRCVPLRAIAEGVIVARPSDGAAVIMQATAAVVWRALDDWTTSGAIDRTLAETYPAVSAAERVAARAEILETLRRDDLLERR